MSKLSEENIAIACLILGAAATLAFALVFGR
jgi:hypothetical protein